MKRVIVVLSCLAIAAGGLAVSGGGWTWDKVKKPLGYFDGN